MTNLIKTIGAITFSAISTAFQQVYPLIVLALLFVLIDCISAWRLSCRARKASRSKNGKTASGKFKSKEMGKTILELIVIIPLGLIMAYWVQKYLFDGLNIRLPQIFAGIVIFWQLWSILENESSCNGGRWAKILQKIMIDKTERHFDVDLSDIKNEKTNEL